MKRLTLLIILSVAISSYSQNRNNLSSILSSYAKSAQNIRRIKYNVQVIDTFANGTVWNNKGLALIKREPKDKLFGFYFYGLRFDINEGNIYDGGNEFWINRANKTYKIEKPGMGYLGSPGGQMIFKELLYPDTVYEKVNLLRETKEAYILKYQFKDENKYSVKDIIKIIELSKKDFFPRKIISLYTSLGHRASFQMSISNIKINSNVKESIESIKKELLNYKIEKEAQPPKSLSGEKAPSFKLGDIFDPNSKIGLPKDKLTLLDFWEVWCAPCIASLPEVEKISRKFANNINVIGIVSDNIKDAKKLVKQKNITYVDLIGNKDLIKLYRIDRYPTYFLIDKNGIVQKEYYGFSPKIEEDINHILREQK